MAAAAAAVPEVVQMFVSGQVAESHAEVDPHQLGDLVGVVVVDTRTFIHRIGHDHLLPDPNNQLSMDSPITLAHTKTMMAVIATRLLPT